MKKQKVQIKLSKSDRDTGGDWFVDPEYLKIWSKESVGRWLESGEGIAGTSLLKANDVDGLLARFEVALHVVSNELEIDFDDIFGDFYGTAELTAEEKETKTRLSIAKCFLAAQKQSSVLDAKRVFDALHLYQCVRYTRRSIELGDAEQAAFQCALATEAAIKLKGRTAEPLLEAGYKHSVLAPAKKTEWHDSLIKAVKRARRTGTPDRKLVGLMHEQFSDHSKENCACYRGRD